MNILTAMAENESLAKKENDGEQSNRACLALHLVGDIHQLLHTAQLCCCFQRRRGGNEICVRVTQTGQQVLGRGDYLKPESDTAANQATALLNRQEFQRSQLTELVSTKLVVGKESFEIATRLLTKWCEAGISRSWNTDARRWQLLRYLWATLLVRAGLVSKGRCLAGYRLADLSEDW